MSAQPSEPTFVSLGRDQGVLLSLREIQLRQLQRRLHFAACYAELARPGGLSGWVVILPRPEPEAEPPTDSDVDYWCCQKQLQFLQAIAVE